MTVTDDQLSAYFDDELDGAERARVNAAIDADPRLQRRIAAFGAINRALVRAMADVDAAPMPASVTAMLKESAYENTVIPLRRRAAPAGWSLPLAAALALGLGVGIGVMAAGGGRGDVMLAGPLRDRSLSAAIETTPSGVNAAIGGGRVATLVLSFENADGAFCREFTLEKAAEKARAIACRESGQWVVKFAAEETGQNGGDYGTAGSGVSATFDDAARGLGGEEPLDPEIEADLISARWTK